MNSKVISILHGIDRRQALSLLTGLGASALIGGAAASSARAQATTCVLSPDLTEGPYFVDENLNRSDIRVDPNTGAARPGVPLTITFNVYSVGAACAALRGAYVDIWHADAGGSYSDVGNTSGQKWLRGYQITDNDGTVRFTTVYPGWYQGRAVHIHFKIRTYSGTQLLGTFTSQFFFNESVTDAVYTQAPYALRPNRDTRNSNDGIYLGAGSNVSRVLLTPAQTTEGYSATLNVGVNLAAGTVVDTSAMVLPQLAFGGGWQTSLLLANRNSAVVSAQISFLSTNGQPLTVPISGVGASSSSLLSLAPRSTMALETVSTGNLEAGWIEASLPAGVMSYALYRWSVAGRDDQEALVPLSAQNTSAGTLLFDEVGASTAFAFANPLSQAGTIAIAAFQSDGTAVGSAAVAVPARSRVTGYLRSLSGLSGIAGTRGIATFTASNGVLCALALRFGPSGFESIPIIYT